MHPLEPRPLLPPLVTATTTTTTMLPPSPIPNNNKNPHTNRALTHTCMTRTSPIELFSTPRAAAAAAVLAVVQNRGEEADLGSVCPHRSPKVVPLLLLLHPTTCNRRKQLIATTPLRCLNILFCEEVAREDEKERLVYVHKETKYAAHAQLYNTIEEEEEDDDDDDDDDEI